MAVALIVPEIRAFVQTNMVLTYFAYLALPAIYLVSFKFPLKTLMQLDTEQTSLNN